jgi:hypothetical protein
VLATLRLKTQSMKPPMLVATGYVVRRFLFKKALLEPFIASRLNTSPVAQNIEWIHLLQCYSVHSISPPFTVNFLAVGDKPPPTGWLKPAKQNTTIGNTTAGSKVTAHSPTNIRLNGKPNKRLTSSTHIYHLLSV